MFLIRKDCNIVTLKKTRWMPDEDTKLLMGVEHYGAKNWTKIAKMIPGRTSKQCRERWTSQLDPTLSIEEWGKEEDTKLLKLQSELGNTWAKISSYLPGRSPNCVKNRYRHLHKKNRIYSQKSNEVVSNTSNNNITPVEVNFDFFDIPFFIEKDFGYECEWN